MRKSSGWKKKKIHSFDCCLLKVCAQNLFSKSIFKGWNFNIKNFHTNVVFCDKCSVIFYSPLCTSSTTNSQVDVECWVLMMTICYFFLSMPWWWCTMVGNLVRTILWLVRSAIMFHIPPLKEEHCTHLKKNCHHHQHHQQASCIYAPSFLPPHTHTHTSKVCRLNSTATHRLMWVVKVWIKLFLNKSTLLITA